MYGIDPNDKSTQQFNPEVGRLINNFSLDRVEKLLKNTGGKIICGGAGTVNTKERYLSPTVVINPSKSAPIMTEEIFGPILPILTYQNFDEVVRFINQGEKPLAIYYQGNPSSKNFRRLQDETSSGNLTANDVLHHTLDTELGFGGVGHSGFGRVGGYESFKNFSNARSIVRKYQVNVWPYNYICPPYGDTKKKVVRIIQSLMSLKQNKVLGGLAKIIIFVLVIMLCFGKLG